MTASPEPVTPLAAACPLTTYLVEVTRTTVLAIQAASHGDARAHAAADAWGWCPENADGLNQGTVSTRVLRVLGEAPAVSVTGGLQP